jgi:hypothetical protein
MRAPKVVQVRHHVTQKTFKTDLSSKISIFQRLKSRGSLARKLGLLVIL